MSNRKRKASNANTNRIFQERWTYDYFFVDVKNKPICLICNQPVSEFKEYNIKRHYVSRHSSAYEKYQNEFRQDKVKELTKVLHGQQMVLSKVSLQQESVVKASYLVAEIIAKNRNHSQMENSLRNALFVLLMSYVRKRKRYLPN